MKGRFYLLLPSSPSEVLDAAKLALDTGVRLLQLRLKGVSDREFLALADQVSALSKEYGASLVVNDRVDVALLSEALGVHLGEEDLPLDRVVSLTKGRLWIGKTVRSLKEAKKAEAEGADYLGVGSVFPSSTKPGAPRIRIEELVQIATSVSIPVYAIGGITLENCSQIPCPPVQGIALCQAVWGSENPKKVLLDFRRKFGF